MTVISSPAAMPRAPTVSKSPNKPLPETTLRRLELTVPAPAPASLPSSKDIFLLYGCAKVRRNHLKMHFSAIHEPGKNAKWCLLRCFRALMRGLHKLFPLRLVRARGIRCRHRPGGSPCAFGSASAFGGCRCCSCSCWRLSFALAWGCWWHTFTFPSTLGTQCILEGGWWRWALTFADTLSARCRRLGLFRGPAARLTVLCHGCS